MTRREKEAYEQGQAIRQAVNEAVASLTIGAGLVLIFFLS